MSKYRGTGYGPAPRKSRNLRFEGDRLIMTTNPQPGVDGRRSTSIFVWERPS
jgi:hypothetical protein